MEDNLENQEEQTLNPSTYLQDLVARAKARKAQTDVGTYGAQALSTMVGQMGGVKTDTRPFEEMRKTAAGEVESAESAASAEEKARRLLDQVRAKAMASKEATLPKFAESSTTLTKDGKPLWKKEGEIGYFLPSGEKYTGETKSVPGTRLELTASGQAGTQKRFETGLADRRDRWEKQFGWNKTKDLNSRVSELQKRLTTGNVAGYEVAKKNVLDNLGSADMAYGRIESLEPGWMLSEKGAKFRGDVARLISPIRKELFGATLTEGEERAFRDMVGTGRGMPLNVFIDSLNKLIEAQDAENEALKTYDPQATQELNIRREGGYVKAPKQGNSSFTDDDKKRLEYLRSKKAAGTLGK